MTAHVLYDSEDEEEDLLREEQHSINSPDSNERITKASIDPSALHSQAESQVHDYHSSSERLRAEMPRLGRDMRGLHSNLEVSLVNMDRGASSQLKRRHSEVSTEPQSTGTVQGKLKRMRSARESSTSVEHGAVETSVLGHSRSVMSVASTCYSTNINPSSRGPGAVLPDNSGDTLPYTEQTQQVMHEMAAQIKKPRSSTKQGGSSNSDLSFPWTADDSPLSARTETADPSLQQSALQPSVVPTQGSMPDEAAHMIEQYLEDHEVDKRVEHTIPSLPRAEGDDTRSARSLLELAQGSQDVLGSPADQDPKKSKKRSQSRRVTNQQGPRGSPGDDSSTNGREHLPTTINPAVLQLPETNTNPFATQTSMEDEIVLARPSTKPQDINSTPIAMDAVIKLLKDRSTPTKFETNSTLNAPMLEQQVSISDTSSMKPPRAKKGAKKKTKRCHTTIFEDHVELQQKQDLLTLSQQQAQRKAALEEIRDSTNKPSGRRGGPKVVLEEDDGFEHNESGAPALDKSELLMVNNIDKVGAAVATQRQTKTKVKISRKAEALVNDADTGTDQELELVEENAEVGSQPDPPRQELPQMLQKQSADHPPELESLTTAQRKVDLNSSPTTHLPLKTNSTVSFRVGLSRRQRIPSLLRVVRPVKTS